MVQVEVESEGSGSNHGRLGRADNPSNGAFHSSDNSARDSVRDRSRCLTYATCRAGKNVSHAGKANMTAERIRLKGKLASSKGKARSKAKASTHLLARPHSKLGANQHAANERQPAQTSTVPDQRISLLTHRHPDRGAGFADSRGSKLMRIKAAISSLMNMQERDGGNLDERAQIRLSSLRRSEVDIELERSADLV